MPRLLALLTLIANLAGCTGFLDLKHDLKTYQDTITHVSGTLAAPDCPSCAILVVALDKQGQPLSYKVFEHPGRFDILVSPRAAKLFVFQDINHDIAFNPGEPYAPHTLPSAHPDGTPLTGIDLKLSAASSPPPAGTYPDGNLFALRNRLVAGIDVQLGSVAKLNEARFDPDRASMGMWQPMQFLKAGLSGIYFLEDYSPNKTPVLFVHGINGTPRDFAELVSRIDRNTYQPWLFYYPSGLEIPTIGDALLNMLNELRQERHFQDLHIVAHSMGGLVSRSLLNTCRLESECDFVRTFTSISSPFGGAQAAKSGVEYAPVVMPVWRSMSPEGPFLADLFSTPLPAGVEHHILFGFRNVATLSATSGDGTIPLDSQLRHAAQQQAASLRGYDEDHLSILRSELTGTYVNAILSRVPPRQP